MLIVVPSRRAGARLADAALAGVATRSEAGAAAIWTGEIMTPRDLVDAAAAAHPEPRKRLGRAATAALLTDVVERLEPEVRGLFGPGIEGPGAARAVGAALAEIRLAGLSAEDVARAAPGRRRLQGLAAALDLWERRLAELGAWDDAAAHRAAAEAVRTGRWPVEPAERLEVRGLYDVTPLQGELLLALARGCASTRVHVPFDPGDEEATRYAFPFVHLWEGITDAGLDVELVHQGGPARCRVEFAAGSNRADEMRRLAAWLRGLGDAGEALEEVAVVMADGGRGLDALAREMDRRGVPWNARRGAPLLETPPVTAALLPFRLLEDGFPRSDLLAWATSPLTTRLDPELLRGPLAAGPAARARLAQWNRALTGARGAPARALAGALKQVDALGRTPLHPAGFWAEYGRVLAEVGLEPGEAWEEALAELREGLESIGRWGAGALPWRAHRRHLVDLLGERRARVGRPGRGVQILTPYDARGLAFGHLAVAGLAQGALAPRDAALPVFGERERRALGARYGTELFRLPGEATAEGALLLHDWLRSTRGWARLSWPAHEDDGAPLLPALEYERLRRARGAPAPDVTRPLPAPAWRLDVDADRVAELQSLEAARAAFFARPALERRGSGGRFDGAFPPIVRAALAAEVDGGALAAWSAGRLETYRQCPHRFFQQYLLAVRPPDAAPLEAEPSAAGRVVHAALQILSAEGGVPARDRIDAALAAAGSAAAPSERGDPDVWRTVLARAGAYLDRYFQRRAADPEADPFVPRAFEARFGLVDDGVPAVPIATALGPVRLRGQIDRIDQDGEGRLRVVDYKYSVASRQRDVVRPEACGVDRFQLWVYYLGARAWAAARGWDPPPAVLGEIHCLRETRGKPVLGAPPSPDPADVAAAIAAAVEAAVAGDYDPSPADENVCLHCDYRRSCRIATVALGAPGAPPEDEE